MNVRRVALVAFNSAAHNKPSLIRDLLRVILPQLYNETKARGASFFQPLSQPCLFVKGRALY